ncbi:MAG: hydroxymyristoyl-ACP dehydratase [Gammaproteobacteria bacterium]|nr:hydroxymyristoyl-ACP dehydratase [Gammaproteobacteria bacterium]
MTSISNALLNKQDIEQRLPHAGKMSLLHKVIRSDQNSLTAQAISHMESDNPLRIEGKIAMVNGIEYAAQAMAVHGSLLSETRAGYLATVRNIDIKVPYFPETGSPLIIAVQLLMSNDNGFTYQFHLSCEQQSLISGKITVFLTHTDSLQEQ